jgi:hypothetical protein
MEASTCKEASATELYQSGIRNYMIALMLSGECKGGHRCAGLPRVSQLHNVY